jgi:hypothetical protein
MENANYFPAATPLLRDCPCFAQERFSLIDVGCSGGIDDLWRIFGDRLEANCFDPQQDEIDRLRSIESNPNVNYHAAYVGLEETHPYHAERRSIPPSSHYYHFDFARSSAGWGLELNAPVPFQSAGVNANLCDRRISLAQFARENAVRSIDFIKTDTDGYDFEVLLSAEELLRPCGVLGCQVECNFTGSAHPAENSFHNIDRFMRHNGFCLYGLSVNRYSRRHLPAPFFYRLLAQSSSGQAIWGDALYLRDGASPHYRAIWGEELPLAKLVKLAMLYELCGLPDCAAELIVTERERFAQVIDPIRLLDALTPVVDGNHIGYDEYQMRFASNIEAFLPPMPESCTLRSPPRPRLLRKVLRKCVGPVRRILRRSA